jgi:hypothetical protein
MANKVGILYSTVAVVVPGFCCFLDAIDGLQSANCPCPNPWDHFARLDLAALPLEGQRQQVRADFPETGVKMNLLIMIVTLFKFEILIYIYNHDI